MRTPHIMLVHPSFPAKTVPEFIAYAKANPGKVNMGSVGIGSTNHVSGELFNMMAGVKMVHVPYRTAGSVFSDLVAAQVDVLFGTAAASIEFVKAGTLRPLAVTSATRWEALPGIPTELGPDQRSPRAHAPFQRAPNASGDLRMAPPNLFEHRYGPNAGSRLQDRHNLAVPNLGQWIRPPSATWRFLLRGQPWIILDAVAGCPAEA